MATYTKRALICLGGGRGRGEEKGRGCLTNGERYEDLKPEERGAENREKRGWEDLRACSKGGRQQKPNVAKNERNAPSSSHGIKSRYHQLWSHQVSKKASKGEERKVSENKDVRKKKENSHSA